MKKISLLILTTFLIVLGISSCDKPELHTGPTGFDGKGRAVVDGREVRFVGRMVYDEFYSQADHKLYEIVFGEPSITMIPSFFRVSLLSDSLLASGSRIDFTSSPFLANGQQVGGPQLKFESWGGDMVDAIYEPDSSAENYIVVQELTDKELFFTFTFNLRHVKGIVDVQNEHTYRKELIVKFGQIRIPLPSEQ